VGECRGPAGVTATALAVALDVTSWSATARLTRSAACWPATPARVSEVVSVSASATASTAA
jgi:hypothetical protein